MRKLLLASALVFPLAASASDYSPSFRINGSLYGQVYTELDLDISRHKRYMAANGVLHTDNGLGAPLSGTCQFNASGGVFCILQSGHLSYVLDVGANLSGTMRALDPDGNIASTFAVNYIGME